MEKLIQQYNGRGQLIFDDNQAATVNYLIEVFQEFDGEVPTARAVRGRVSHAEGHPDWHPVAALHTGPFTLVLDDGRKLSVFLENLQGSFRATGGFF